MDTAVNSSQTSSSYKLCGPKTSNFLLLAYICISTTTIITALSQCRINITK